MIHHDLIACPYCDSLYKRPDQKIGQALYCQTCGACIDRGVADFKKAFIFATTSIILFAIANLAPFITLSMPGSLNTISILSSIQSLFDSDLNLLGIIVFLLIIVIPLWYMLGILWVVMSFRFNIFSNITGSFLHWMSKMAPWSMLEVYLIGVIVTLVKITQIADLSFNIGFWAFVVLMFTTVLSNFYFHLNDALLFYRYTEKHDA